ncbi:FGGY-family carbohydrate kinase [Actinotalea sp. M2MS4P-6]|uniref:rhamnulokinase n=1 Tax=Actinotalea sp. M2MS4P-6 TaxID=2983762 RepID=UPI0021E50D28|nr:FGGY-family carbohydrate kinase [Actinotalea sp. M2MS4P-6]MCV2394252.1 FGGY-family carbohydrate kinase [Actinotalea sp. M2MS4P-6]
MDDVAAVAVDLGSSSGRVLLGTVRDDVLTLTEVHRFPHEAREHDGALSWDLDRLESEIGAGLRAAVRAAPVPVVSVAVDTWGVDYVLLDRAGRRVGPGHTYRDPRTGRIATPFYARLSAEQRWAATGVHPADINTANQLAAELAEGRELDRVSALQLLPDWFAHRLGGRPGWGRSIASTTGLCRPGAAGWSEQVLAADGVPPGWLGPVTADGTVRGRWTEDDRVAVVSAGHDTACAVHAMPAEGEGVAFVAAGSWSVVGLETPAPVVTPDAFAAGLTNEARLDGGNRLLANLTGLWILQECVRQWRDDGAPADLVALVAQAERVASSGVTIDPDDPRFVAPGRMADRVADHVEQQHGVRITDPARLVRLVLESLAESYARSLARLEQVAGQRVSTVHLVGGGSRTPFLCRLTADATGRRVVAGPAEASGVGNVLVQLEATGRLGSRADRADLVRRSFAPVVVEPAGAR